VNTKQRVLRGGPDEVAKPVRLSGWGRVGGTVAVLQRPRSAEDVASLLANGDRRGSIARGLGRSYGDEAKTPEPVFDMTAMDRIRPFDYRAGLVTVEAGISIDALLRFVLLRGWFPAVSPGTGFATIGGAIANDVHGKDHPSARGFVRSIRILTPTWVLSSRNRSATRTSSGRQPVGWGLPASCSRRRSSSCGCRPPR
jgi:decaprenylphospho-beta-D-ribofuranose 2-oxidase